MTDAARAALGLGADPRMPRAVVTMLFVQVVIVVGWCLNATTPLMLAWADFGGDAVFFSHELGFSILLSTLALCALLAAATSMAGVLGLYRQRAPGEFAMLAQVVAVMLTAVGGLISIFTGTILVLLLVPFLVLNVVLSKLRSSRRWFDSWCFADSPRPWGMFVLTLTTMAIPLWIVSSAGAFLGVLLSLLFSLSGEGDVDAVGVLALALVLVALGPVANVIVLLAVARQWRLPRLLAVIGSVLAAIGLVILAPMLWWAAVIAIAPPMLLWVPAVARGLSSPAPDTTSGIGTRHPG